MAPAGYMTTAAIEAGLRRLNDFYPGFTQLIDLPELSAADHLRIRALRIRAGEGNQNGVLLLGGVHSDELINPDALVGLALKLCWAYDNDEGLQLGGKPWSAADIRLIVGGVDSFIVPNINPDGRRYVLSDYEKNHDWRKNRSGSDGTDLNRNYDFLWKEEIGNTSTDPTSDVYKGSEPFSEPETRNVRWLLRTYPHITHLADVHSSGEAMIHPWGDAHNQSEDSTESFRNPAWDDMRDDPDYEEYIPAVDQTTLIELGRKVSDAVAAVRGHDYSVGQSWQIPEVGYLTTGTSKDYAYSRFFRGPNTKVWAYTIETVPGRDAPPPPFPEAARVIEEVQSGLIQFMLTSICLVREIGRGIIGPEVLDDLAHFRDEEMLRRQRGRRWVHLVDRHGEELVRLIIADRPTREAAEQILVEAAEIAHARGSHRPPVVTNALTERIEQLTTHLEKRASPRLRKALKAIQRDVRAVAGKTAREAIR